MWYCQAGRGDQGHDSGRHWGPEVPQGPGSHEQSSQLHAAFALGLTVGAGPNVVVCVMPRGGWVPQWQGRTPSSEHTPSAQLLSPGPGLVTGIVQTVALKDL